MNKFIILFFILISAFNAYSQRDTLKRVNNKVEVKNIEKIKLNTHHEQWLNLNYKQIAVLPRDSAMKFIKKNFPKTAKQNEAYSEGALEYILAQVAKLIKSDNTEQLAQVRLQLQSLKEQKQSLINKIHEKEQELSGATDNVKRTKIQREIVELRFQLASQQLKIDQKEKEIKQLVNALRNSVAIFYESRFSLS